MVFDNPMLRSGGSLSAEVQCSALLHDIIFQIAKVIDAELFTLLHGEIIKYPIAKVPGRH